MPTTYANGWTEKISNSQPSNKKPRGRIPGFSASWILILITFA
nr:MAG TPA: hypothetical protein [Inoviridae sp.]